MLHQIGAGALGPVFRAYQPEPGRLVAVKLFRLDLPPEKVHQLVAELERLVAVELSHPGIAAPIGAGLNGVSAYLAQDFVAGDSLDVVVRAGGASTPAVVARVAAQLGSALDYAADCDVFHGSLHPRDVLMSDDDVRITGVGVTRALAHVGISTPVRRPYSAPERAVGGPWDGRADMFSLAALTFELLYGRRVSGAGERAVASLPEIPGTSRPALKRVFAKALSGDPAGRFSSGAAFADALQGALIDAAPIAVPLLFEPEPAIRGEMDESRLVESAETVPMPVNEPATASELPTSGGRATPRDMPEATHLTESDLHSEPAEAPLLAFESQGFDVSREFGAEHPNTVEHTLSTHDLDLHPGDVLDTSVVPSHLGALSDAADDEREDGTDAVPPPFAAMALESTRSAVWPLVLALVVGIAIGFGMAMLFIGRGQPIQSARQVAAPVSVPSVVAEPPIVPVTDASRPPAPASTGGGSETAAPVAPMPAPPAPVNEPLATPPAESTPPAAARREPARAPARPEPPARRILVRSTPSGAQVFLDGKSAGVTPLTVRDVGAGVHAVRVTRDGYVTADRRVAITDSRPVASVTVELARARPAPRVAPVPVARAPRPAPAARTPAASAAPASRYGALIVDSRPSGASVFIDGRLMGRTPLLLDEVEAREHVIAMDMAGYKRWASSIAVVGGVRTRVAASLEQ